MSTIKANAIVDAAGTGAPTLTNGAVLPAGSAAAPAISPTGDSNTGLFFPATDTVAITTGGSERMRVTSGGLVGIGTTPTTLLHLSGSAAAGQDPTVTLANTTATTGRTYQIISGDGGPFRIQDATAAAERMRIDSSGNVGIGTTTPGAVLDINGNAFVRGAGAEGGEIDLFNPDRTTIGMSVDVSSANTGRIFQGQNNSILQLGQLVGTGGIVTLHTAATEAMRIDAFGNVSIATTSSPNTLVSTTTEVGIGFSEAGYGVFVRDSSTTLYVNRLTNDGALVEFRQAGVSEGTISVSGTTVSYNGGHLSRWAQFPDGSRPELLKGTVMSNLDQMSNWDNEENEQLNCVEISTVEGDANVAGLFVAWDSTEDDYNDILLAMTGDMVIRIAAGVTVARGDLLMSAGDGTAKPQADDIIRAKTIAKVTSNHVSHTYADGSYAVPCVVMAC